MSLGAETLPFLALAFLFLNLVAAPKISPSSAKSKAEKAKHSRRCASRKLSASGSSSPSTIPSPRDREKLSIEAIALAAKLDIRHLWGEIMLAMREHSVNSVKVIAVANHPEVIKRRVEFAQLPGGFRDRDALDTMLGASAVSTREQRSSISFLLSGSREDDDPISRKRRNWWMTWITFSLIPRHAGEIAVISAKTSSR
jgi:hypothetical protein